MITSITLICSTIGLAFLVRRLYKLRRQILSRWESAFRHIVAILAGLSAFVGLFGLLQLLDLLERDAFSVNALFNTVQLSLALLMGGGIIVAASIALCVEDR